MNVKVYTHVLTVKQQLSTRVFEDQEVCDIMLTI